MIVPDDPLDKGPMPGMRNMPVPITSKAPSHDLKEEQKINQKWFKHFFDGLGSVE